VVELLPGGAAVEERERERDCKNIADIDPCAFLKYFIQQRREVVKTSLCFLLPPSGIMYTMARPPVTLKIHFSLSKALKEEGVQGWVPYTPPGDTHANLTDRESQLANTKVSRRLAGQKGYDSRPVNQRDSGVQLGWRMISKSCTNRAAIGLLSGVIHFEL